MGAALRAERAIATRRRARPANVEDGVVRERSYTKLRTNRRRRRRVRYRPRKCTRDYRMVALRKSIPVERSDNVLFDEYRYFFYITSYRAMPRLGCLRL